MSTIVADDRRKRWDERLLKRLQGGKAEGKGGLIDSRWWAVPHLPLLIPAVAFGHGTFRLVLGALWIAALMVALLRLLHERRKTARSTPEHDAFGR